VSVGESILADTVRIMGNILLLAWVAALIGLAARSPETVNHIRINEFRDPSGDRSHDLRRRHREALREDFSSQRSTGSAPLPAALSPRARPGPHGSPQRHGHAVAIGGIPNRSVANPW
jgi:hypothetical protein